MIGTTKRSAPRLLLVLLATLITVLITAALAQPTIAELRRATEQQPGNVDVWINLGNAYLAANDFDKAKESFLEAIAIDYRAADAHFGLGLAEYQRGDYQAALFAFNEVARLFPERFDGHYNRAVTLARLRQHQEAAAAFREAIAQAEPEATVEDLVSAYLGLAGQLKRVGDYLGAADAYAEALQLQPDRLELAYLRGEALYQAGRGLDALPDLIEVESASNDYRISSLIADIYVDAGQVDYALRSLERALRKVEETGDLKAQASILVKLGLMQRELGRDAEAARSFQQAANIDPTSWEAFYNLGVSYLESGQTRSALSALESARQINGDSGEVFLALASTYDQLAQSAQAMENAQLALERLSDPELQLQAHFIIGRALYRQGDYRAAAREFEQVVSSDPSNAQAQLWAGLAEYQQGNYRAAVQYYERAVQLDPESVEARVNLGAAYLASERYQDAELVYQLLVQQNPGDAESYYNLGWALLSQQRRGAARDAWLRASELGYQPAVTALDRYF